MATGTTQPSVASSRMASGVQGGVVTPPIPRLAREAEKPVTVPRLVRVTMESSPYFKLVGPSGVCRKVPPGMCSTLRIVFTPGENKDYFHCLFCTTEREEFIVPIRAIGARAVLDFPDQLDFSVCPVKYSTQKTLMVHNLGNREAHYQISTQSPFSVIPTMGTLGIGDTLQVTVEFHPLQTGDHCASLVVHYGTVVAVALSQKALLRVLLAFKTTPELSERAKVQGDPMLFFDDIFTIKPVEGEIWPNSSAEISVIFRPREGRVYKHAVYCDISGRETRLPLRLIGEGLGPRLHFQFEELDIGKVSVISLHRYEAILVNKGPIEGLFSLIPPTTAVGSCFTFLPQQGILAPDGLQAISISFRTTIPGEFKEEFQFRVNESPKPVTLTIRGYVIGPTFHFDVRALHFGDVAFGECAQGLERSVRGLCVAEMEHLSLRASVTRVPPQQP
ncbi:hypothetical protein BTVI_57561 [Pitangus sulphuratus]|nr:hypothetical protein BTVI_57561 [Pitangus sulphuratus]